MPELTIPLLGFLALKEILSEKTGKKELIKSLKFALGITGGLCVLFAFVGPSLFNFTSNGDAQLPDFIVSALEVDRASLLRSDALRSLFFILLTGLSIYLFLKKKIKMFAFATVLAVLVLADMLPVNKRYLNADDFVKARKMEQPFKKTPVDAQILEDKELNFRVYNLAERLDAGARTSYFHNNIAGYHGAKLKRYQELIDLQLSKANASVVNMLNTKYIIRKGPSGDLIASQNSSRYGPAWLVKEVEVVANADEEMKLLSTIDLSNKALVDQRFGLSSTSYSATGSILLSSYEPNHLVYDVNVDEVSFAVFSEIFYDKGWNAYINGELKEHYRVNYVLRGMNLPKGEYQVEFKFEPQSVAIGSSISLVSSCLIYLLLAFVGFKFVIKD